MRQRLAVVKGLAEGQIEHEPVRRVRARAPRSRVGDQAASILGSGARDAGLLNLRSTALARAAGKIFATRAAAAAAGASAAGVGIAPRARAFEAPARGVGQLGRAELESAG